MIEKLLHLRIACFLYNQISSNDSVLIDFFNKYSDLELSDDNQIKGLIDWLRKWGCRQFKIENEEVSIKNFKKWNENNRQFLPEKNLFLIEYSLKENGRTIIEMFNDLSKRAASEKKLKKGKNSVVTIGPVGVAKTLFALRPNLFAPWDNPIIKYFKLERNGLGYVQYLLRIQNELRNIKYNFCGSKETVWNDLFDYLDKKHKYYPKLIDEYYWMTITKEIKPSIIEMKWPFLKNSET